MIQRYLADGGTIDNLLTAYGIKAKRHRSHENLVLFKYDQIASPMGEQIVQECRGIILDESAGWSVVACAFHKFFNSGEGHAAAIDWHTARVQEKVDGSLITVYWYAGAWHAASSGTPDGCGSVNGIDQSGTWEPAQGHKMSLPDTFAGYFWQTLSVRAPGLFKVFEPPRDHCYVFELTGPLNRIVVRHTEANVTLLAARHVESGNEIDVGIAGKMLDGQVRVVRSFPLGDIEGVLATFSAMSPLAQEGYVIVDGKFNRIKVKHPGYVALHHAKDGLTTRAFVEIARSGETSEVIAAFPELRPQLDEAKARLDELIADVERDYATHQHHAVQKDFALAVKGSRCSAALFSVRSKRVDNVRAFMASTSIDSVMKMLGYKADKPIEIQAE